MPRLSGCISELGIRLARHRTGRVRRQHRLHGGEAGRDVEIHETRLRSVSGASYSQRTPAVSVNDGPMRQSSVM